MVAIFDHDNGQAQHDIHLWVIPSPAPEFMMHAKSYYDAYLENYHQWVKWQPWIVILRT